jgi:hypothetical protein
MPYMDFLDRQPELDGLAAGVLRRIVDDLANIPEVVGLMLGGSHSFGGATATSDYDLIVYYERGRPVGNESLISRMSFEPSKFKPSTSGRRMGIEVDGVQVEFFYASLNRLERVAQEAARGEFSLLPDRFFPQGRLSLDHVGFLTLSHVLLDPQGKLEGLRRSVLPMPLELRRTLLQFALDGARIALKNARKVRSLPEHIMHLMAHVFLFVWYVEIGLFAANGCYPATSKQASVFLARLPLHLPDYTGTLMSLFAAASRGQLDAAFQLMQRLLTETSDLAQKA